MLLPTMTDAEVNAEVLRDFARLSDTTILRLHNEYCNERQKFKIDKTKVYPKVYHVKTAAKNNWMIVITKANSEPKHRGLEDQQAGSIVTYFSKHGHRFIRPSGPGKPFEVFHGHFFTRYNERMKLGLSNHQDIVAHFFTYSSNLLPLNRRNDGLVGFTSLCKAGMALGFYPDQPYWQVYRTFINHDLKHLGQKKGEENLESQVHREIMLFINRYRHSDPTCFEMIRGGIKEIFGSEHEITQLFQMLSVTGSKEVKLPEYPKAFQPLYLGQQPPHSFHHLPPRS